MEEIFKKNWDNWVDNKIPALGGISPREAIKTKDGIESVKALLNHIERPTGLGGFSEEQNRKGVAYVRKLLGLGE